MFAEVSRLAAPHRVDELRVAVRVHQRSVEVDACLARSTVVHAHHMMPHTRTQIRSVDPRALLRFVRIHDLEAQLVVRFVEVKHERIFARVKNTRLTGADFLRQLVEAHPRRKRQTVGSGRESGHLDVVVLAVETQGRAELAVRGRPLRR